LRGQAERRYWPEWRRRVVAIKPNAQIAHAASFPEIRLGDEEIVLLDVTGSVYYTLTGLVSVRIWQNTDPPCTLSSLVARLVEEFDIDTDTCERQTAYFLRRLQSCGLLSVTDTPGASDASFEKL
jgi:hypothetical protein